MPTCDRHALTRRAVLFGSLALAGASGLVGHARAASEAKVPGWDDILRDGSGQDILFHASGGDERTNTFIAWAGGRMRDLYGVRLRHVKLRDAAEAVARIAAEKAAGSANGAGSVDLVWVGGADLAALRQNGLLEGPVLDLLPASRLVARIEKPATVMDRMIPMDGYAVPWRLAQLVFVQDLRDGADPPRNVQALLDWALRHPGRFGHPGPRDPIGLVFLQQALYGLITDPVSLHRPVTPDLFARAAAPLWDWYDRLRPALWQGGKAFPANQAQQRNLMREGRIELMVSLDPSEAVVSIAAATLQPSARAYVLDGGTIGKCSFLGVPFNAAHRAGALLTANFLLSPEAQARASDPRFLGVPTVLAMDRLSADDYVYFDAVPRMRDLLSDAERGVPLLEPHVTWGTQIIEGWERRYAG